MRRCPVCRHEVIQENNEWRPFCSERCQQIDLGRWAAEEYRVPVTRSEVEDFVSEIQLSERGYDEHAE